MFSLFVFVFNMLIGAGPTGHRICGGAYECSWRRGLKAKQSKCSWHSFILRLMIKSLSPIIQVKEIESFVIVYKYKDRFTSPFARTLRVITKMFGECVLHNFTLWDVNQWRFRNRLKKLKNLVINFCGIWIGRNWKLQETFGQMLLSSSTFGALIPCTLRTDGTKG